MKKYIFFSAAIHLILFLFTVITLNNEKNTQKTEEGPFKGNEVKVEIVERPENPSPDEALEDKSEDGISSIINKEKDCISFFGGVGIQQDFFTLKIEEVYKNYPADRAGIMVGDIVESQNGEDIRGKIGAAITVKVTRNGISFYVTLIREKICYEDI